MSLYFMYNYSSNRNIMKVGYMSTVKIKQIMGRYATSCGRDIMVFMFSDHEPRLMETNFKKHFEKQHVELEFYDSNHLLHYIRWATEYTNSPPIVGDGRLKYFGESENKPIRDVEPMKAIPKIVTQTIDHPYRCDQCGYCTQYKENIKKHLNKNTKCGSKCTEDVDTN